MKIIEGLKEIKRLEIKVNELTEKIIVHCADQSHEIPMYPDQKGIVAGWLQSIHDTLKEAMRLRIQIQQTNMEVPVGIMLGGVQVSHTIAEWIIRRRLYANSERKAWNSLSDRGLKEGKFKKSSGEILEVNIRRYYDPLERDRKVDIYNNEPGIIDRTLEVVNATTDLVD